MIHIECTWCDGDLVLSTLDAPSLDCPECGITVEFAPDPETLAVAA